MNRLALAGLALVVLMLSLVSASAGAQEVPSEQREAARERFARGVEKMRVDDYAGAAGDFVAAYELAPYAVIRFNLAVAYSKLDRPVDAADVMTKVLAEPGNLSGERIAQGKRLLAEQQRRIGELQVEVSEAGATLRVDGADAGKSPLSSSIRVAAGVHYVEAVKQGFAPARREVRVAAAARESVRLVLDPNEQPLAQLWIRSPLAAAEIWLDGMRIGVTPLQQTVPVVPGRHQIELRRRGYRTARDSVEVGPGVTAELELAPRVDVDALDQVGGYLALEDEWADEVLVTVDGQRRGLYAGPLQLAPGVHDLRLERAGFYPAKLRVDIAPGATKSQKLVLQPTPEKIADHEQSVAVFRGVAIGTLVAGLAVAGGGIGYTVWNEGRIDEADAELTAATAPGARCSSGGLEQPECLALVEDLDSARARRPVGYVLIGVGGALLVTSVVLFVLAPDSDELEGGDATFEDARVQPLVEVAPGGARLGISGRF